MANFMFGLFNIDSVCVYTIKEIVKVSFSLQSQRKAMPKNAQTTAQLHSSHMLANNAQNSPSQALALREL